MKVEKRVIPGVEMSLGAPAELRASEEVRADTVVRKTCTGSIGYHDFYHRSLRNQGSESKNVA